MSNLLIPNSTQVPHVITDVLIPLLPDAEARCLLYIARRTYGFRKVRDRISFTQFESGMTDKGGSQLDYGTGMARSSVSRGINGLIKLGIVLCDKKKSGSFYEINLEVDIEQVVAQSYQYRKATKTGSAKLPQVVAQSYTQNKGEIKEIKNSAPAVADAGSHNEKLDKKRRKKIRAERLADTTPQSLDEFIAWCRGSPNRHIRIIGEYADEKRLNFETKGQWYAFMEQNLTAASLLKPFTDEQIAEALGKIRKSERTERNPTGYMTPGDWTLETVKKVLMK